MSFVAQINLRTISPKRHTDLRHAHRQWRTQLREAIQDRNTHW
jgi:hypothetical protein